MEYKFGNKNNWRRWAWNRVVERLSVKPRDALVLYLDGGESLDRAIAKSHGFRSENLIAIERDKAVLTKLRDADVLAVNGDAGRVLCAWPFDKPVHAAVLDFCSNFDGKALADVSDAVMFNPAFARCVFLVNIQAGREKRSWQCVKEMNEIADIIGFERGNRAQLFYWQLFVGWQSFWEAIERGASSWADVPSACDAHSVAKLLYAWNGRFNPAFRSYISTSRHHMYSAVFKSGFLWDVQFSKEELSANARKISKALNHELAGQKRRISAILAHRTMRLAA